MTRSKLYIVRREPSEHKQAQVPNNLPAQRTPLIGRQEEVTVALGLLEQSAVRLLTLVGPGGVGKTRLALQIAEELLAEFEEGLYFIDLAPITGPELVIPTIAGTLEVREVPKTPLLSTLKEHLEEKKMLLVLDNFEQVLPAGKAVGELLAACPDLKVLVTSRSPLRLRAEKQFEVAPLALPEAGRALSLSSLSHYGAVALFVERAGAVEPDFALTESNASAVADICRRVDGLPLAIELVAARVRLLPPQSILARLGHPLRLLTGGAQGLPGRHETMRDAIEWSYQLLAEPEQRLVRRLSIFVGGCSLRAAEAVCNEAGDISIESDHPLAIEVLDGVQSLVDKSLVRKVPQEGDDPRLAMLQMVREYAWEQLVASGDAEGMRRRHADYYLALTEQVKQDLVGQGRTMCLRQLDAEYGNLRSAVEWFLERGVAGVGAEALSNQALRLIIDLDEFWNWRMHRSDHQRWLERALVQTGPRATPLRARAFNTASGVARGRADYQQARAWAEEALATAGELGDGREIASALNMLGGLAVHEGDYETARIHTEAALTAFRELGADRQIATTVGNLGTLARYQGDYQRAESLCQESLHLLQTLGDKTAVLHALTNLAQAVHHQGDPQGDPRRAKAIFEEALAMALETNSRRAAARALAGLAGTIVTGALRTMDRRPKVPSHDLREMVQAARLLGTALAVRERGGGHWDPLGQAEFDQSVATARTHLSEEAFTLAWEEGQAMTLDQALELANQHFGPEDEGSKPKARGRPRKQVTGGLTDRENEVAALVAQGMTNGQIAGKLVLSVRTVEMHVANAMQKLGVHTRTELAGWAMRQSVSSESMPG